MKLSRHLKRNILRLLLAVALFAQCSVPAGAYAATSAAPAEAAAMSSGMPCHDKVPAKSACIVHCSQADQASLDHAHLAAPLASTAVWQVAVPVAPALASGARYTGLPRLAAGPPLSILYCSFLN